MVRSELVKTVSERNPGLSLAEVDTIVTLLFEELAAHLSRGGRVELRGFGTFSTRARGARDGRNPKTGEKVVVEAKRVVYFRPGQNVRQRLNC